MRTRPLLTTSAAVAALALGAAASTAGADTTTPAAGTSSSSLTLLDLALAGHDLHVGKVALLGSTLSGSPVSQVVVTPLSADGTNYGQQTVTPAGSPQTVPVLDSSTVLPGALAALASLRTPALAITSSDSGGARSTAGADSLGTVSVLGIPLQLNGTAAVTSAVTSAGSLGEKTLTLKNLALPSVADLLAALGLDLSKLPTATLTELLSKLNLTTTAVTTASQALDTAEATIKAQLDAANATLTTALATAADKAAALKTADANLATATATLAPLSTALDAAKAQQTTAQGNVTTANAALTTATATLTSATTTLTNALAALTPALTIAQYEALPQAGKDLLGTVIAGDYSAYTSAQSAVTAANATLTSATAALTAATSALASAQSAYDVAKAALDAATAVDNLAKSALTAALAAVDAARAALASLLTGVQPQIDALVAAVKGVLSTTPLVSIDSLTVQTVASADSASVGGQTAKVVGGQLTGLHVLGTDVLNNVLGSSTVNVTDLAGSTLASVTSAVNALTGTLSSVLSNVPSLPTLAIPAPQIGLLTKTTSTSISGGFGRASDSVHALTVTIPAITLPSAVALPSAAMLPAFGGLPSTAGADLVSQPITLGFGTLAEAATFKPGATTVFDVPPAAQPPAAQPPAAAPPAATPGSTPPTTLATTGLPTGVTVLAFLSIGGAVLLRRRLRES